MFIRPIGLFFLLFLFVACSVVPSKPDGSRDSYEEDPVTTIAYPSLHLSDAKTAILVDRVREGFQVYTLPDLQELFARSSSRGIYKVYLSSSGRSVAWTTPTNELVIQASQLISYSMPYTYHQIRALAFGDALDRVAFMVYDKDTGGRLEVWSLPFGDQPLVVQPFTVFGHEELAVTPSFGILAAHSSDRMGTQAVTELYHYDDQSNVLSVFWTDTGSQAPRVASSAILNDAWVCIVTESAVLGWNEASIHFDIPATMRDNVILSPDGKYLLIYHSVGGENPAEAQYTFRLLELSSRQEIRQVSHSVDQTTRPYFILADDLSILELHVTQDGQLQQRSLSW